jgi:Zn-dependent protease
MIDILFQQGPIAFLIVFGSLIVVVSVHEFAHAFTADKLGDPTPRLQGRLSLNPKVHLDPIGTLMLAFFGFGWGKPVVFDPYNLKNPRRDSALISLAGPASNISLALVISLLLRLFNGPFFPQFVVSIFSLVVFYNLLLAFFNLIPIHPLDGGKIFIGLIPAKDVEEADTFLKRYGLFILILLIFPIFGGRSPISTVLLPLIGKLMHILLPGNPIT